MDKFSSRLKYEMKTKGISQRELEKKLVNSGITNITYKRISEYVREISTPVYDKAKEIFDILDVSVTDKELKEMLRLNREDIRRSHEEFEYELTTYSKKLPLQIKLRDILSTASPDYTEDLLNARVEELFSGFGRDEMTKYVEKLIREDLLAYIETISKKEGNTVKRKRRPGRSSLTTGRVYKILRAGGGNKET